MAIGMKLDTSTKTSTEDSKAIALSNNETTSKSIDTITIIKTDGSKIENVENTAENIAKAKEDGYTIEAIKPDIKTEEKVIDSITNENVTKPIKKTPADFGEVNQPVFETLESIRKVITMPMTGEEIKNTFDISPGLKINSKTLFRPLS